MELKGSKTEKNLMEAFAGESQARNKYTYFASQAKKEGYVQMAKIFEETAANEKEHAKIWFKLLNGGEIPDTATCLKMAAGGEHEEWTEMYPRMAKEAKEEVLQPDRRPVHHGGPALRRSTRSATSPWPRTWPTARSLPARSSRSGSAPTAATPYIGKSAPLKCPVCAHPPGLL